jgi:hypothetical protein
MHRGFRLAATAALALVLCVCSCKQKRSSTPIGGAGEFLTTPDLTTLPGTVYDVKLGKSTVKVEPGKFRQAIRSISPDRSIFIFDKSSDVVRDLAPGKIMLVPGLTLRKVSAVAQDGNDLIVGTEEAPLTEAFDNAKLKWDYQVNFRQSAQQLQRAALAPSGSELGFSRWAMPDLIGTVHADGGTSKSGENENWEYTVNTQPDSGGLNFELHLKRKTGGLTGTIEVTGYIQNFHNAVSLVIQDNKLESFDFHNRGMTAVANVKWTVARGESGPMTGEERFKIPVSFSVPLIIGGLPFSLELSEAVMFKPGFTTKDEIARGAFKIRHSGDDGFSMTSSSFNSDGDAQGDGDVTDGGGIAPLAPFAVLIAIAAPRVELKTGPEAAFEQLQQLTPFTSNLADHAARLLRNSGIGHWIGNTLENAIKTEGAAHVQVIVSTSAVIGSATALVPCQKTQLVFTADVGADAKVFGVTVAQPSKEIFRKEKFLINPPVKACS